MFYSNLPFVLVWALFGGRGWGLGGGGGGRGGGAQVCSTMQKLNKTEGQIEVFSYRDFMV